MKRTLVLALLLGLPGSALVAQVVHLAAGQSDPAGLSNPPSGTDQWEYRVTGNRAVRPSRIVDDGAKTFVEFHPDQALPAVFGIGPTGGEEVVAGYMRDGVFVIDRVYPALVFRIDQAQATAQRRERRN